MFAKEVSAAEAVSQEREEPRGAAPRGAARRQSVSKG